MPALSATDPENRHFFWRGLALFLFLAFIAVNLFSDIYGIAHWGHEHDCAGANGGCAVCLAVQAAQSLNLKLFVPGAPALPVLFFLAAAIILNKPRGGSLFSATPVDLKVRLNN
ncbi:MAG: hypothetical protein LBJ25_06375 [Candidatus Margulisbacteria bacterium]|jgi:hypothetical protein|nr:hypothetical protein [Candidatus Margulisiibacteriota bacterium]